MVTATSVLYSMQCSVVVVTVVVVVVVTVLVVVVVTVVVVVVTVIRRIRTRSLRTRRIINILLRRIGITPGGAGRIRRRMRIFITGLL